MAPVIAEPKTIPLSSNSRIVMDFDGSLIRMAYYHPVREKSGQLKLARDTAKGTSLRETLFAILGTDRYTNQLRGIEGYIRATEWGKDLP